MSWSVRQSRCKYCNQDIETSTPEIQSSFRQNGNNMHNHYHVECWVQSGLDYLKDNAPNNGHLDRIELTDEQRMLRYQLLHKHASLLQRQQKLSHGNPRYAILNANIEAQLAQLILEILPLGGVPKKWVT